MLFWRGAEIFWRVCAPVGCLPPGRSAPHSHTYIMAQDLQQSTYGVAGEGVFGRKSAESLRKLAKISLIASEKSAESLQFSNGRGNPKKKTFLGVPPFARSTSKTISASKREMGTLQKGSGHLQSRIIIGDKIITYRFLCFGELFSVIITGNFTACNSWGN